MDEKTGRRFPRGKRGLKSGRNGNVHFKRMGRFPRGKRGLKLPLNVSTLPLDTSLPSREAWIEIAGYQAGRWEGIGRFPRGKRGLKCQYVRFYGEPE